MALPKKPGPLPLASMGSDEEGRKSKIPPSSEWTSSAVEVLLNTYVQKFSVGRGYLRNKDWEEVVNNVNTHGEGLKMLKTMKQCRDKVDSLKRRYKMEKRKAVNGIEVTWPFFAKLDDMMGSVLKQNKGLDPLDNKHKKSPMDEEDEKADLSASPEECALDSMRYDAACRELLGNGKHRGEEIDGFSDDGFHHNHYGAPLKFFNFREPQISTDNSSEQVNKASQFAGLSGNSRVRKRKMKSDHPMQALADAITGFTEVFARVELAKMEIMTTMKLEMAKLRMKRHKKQKHRRKESSGSSSSSSG